MTFLLDNQLIHLPAASAGIADFEDPQPSGRIRLFLCQHPEGFASLAAAAWQGLQQGLIAPEDTIVFGWLRSELGSGLWPLAATPELSLRQLAYAQGYYASRLHLHALSRVFIGVAQLREYLRAQAGSIMDICLYGAADRALLAWEQLLDAEQLSFRRLGPQPGTVFNADAAFVSLRGCAERWAALPEHELAAAWQGPEGATYRFCQDLRLWRFDGLMRDRALVEGLIQGPPSLAAELALLLYKRLLRAAAPRPDWLQQIFAHYRSVNLQQLEILPPVQDFTVTVIVPAFNRPQVLKRALDSIRAQTVGDWRVIIGDDNSPDPEVEALCRAYAAADERIRYLRHPRNQGFAKNFDILCEAVETELMIALCDDDYLEPNFIEVSVGLMRAKPWLSIVITPCHYVNDSGRVGQIGPYYSKDGVGNPYVEFQRAGGTGAVYLVGFLYRKQVLFEIAEYDIYHALMQEDAESGYAMTDCSIAGACLLKYEVGYVRNTALNYWLWPDNGFKQRDNSFEHVRFFRFVLEAYYSLFGAGRYPRQLADFVDQYIVFHSITPSLTSLLDQADLEAYHKLLPVRLRHWREFVEMRQYASRVVDTSYLPMFDHERAFGDNPWGRFTCIPSPE